MNTSKVILILFLTLIAAAVGALFWLQDANNLKAELEQLLNENGDYTISINGDMDWQLFPPLRLHIRDISVSDDDFHAQVAELQLHMDLSAMWQDQQRWQISELHLLDTTITNADDRIHISQFDLTGFNVDTPAPFYLQALIPVPETDDTSSPLNIELDGAVTYSPASVADGAKLQLVDTQFMFKQPNSHSAGICQLSLQGRPTPPPHLPEPGPEELLPLDILLDYNFSANCDLAEFTYAGATFANSTLVADNRNEQLTITLDIQDFFAGKLTADVQVDLTSRPLTWLVRPKVTNVDTRPLLAWAEQDLQWAALLAANSKITLQGNTTQALAESVQAESNFDGGSGRINITRLKQQVARLALLAGKRDEVAAWPDNWDYKEFVGTWQVNGRQQKLNFNLDNMQVAAEGEYDYRQQSVDMLAHITVHDAEDSPFSINPLLAGTAIPIRCTGAVDNPECKLDEQASRSIIAKALQRDDKSGLRAKLEQKIDEKVPAEYRETARNLLELLGRGLEKNDSE